MVDMNIYYYYLGGKFENFQENLSCIVILEFLRENKGNSLQSKEKVVFSD